MNHVKCWVKTRPHLAITQVRGVMQTIYFYKKNALSLENTSAKFSPVKSREGSILKIIKNLNLLDVHMQQKIDID